MTAGMRTGSGLLGIFGVFLGMCVLAVGGFILLSALSGAAVQVAPKPTPPQVAPQPTPDLDELPNEEFGGIDVQKAAEEAREVIPNLKPGGEMAPLAQTTDGMLRVGRSIQGQLFVCGARDSGQVAAAEAIAKLIGAIVP